MYANNIGLLQANTIIQFNSVVYLCMCSQGPVGRYRVIQMKNSSSKTNTRERQTKKRIESVKLFTFQLCTKDGDKVHEKNVHNSIC
jgi:hypothetical protein